MNNDIRRKAMPQYMMGPELMRLVPCRDCGEMLPATARGCPKCARNMEAERSLQIFARIALMLVLLLVAGVLAVIFFITART